MRNGQVVGGAAAAFAVTLFIGIVLKPGGRSPGLIAVVLATAGVVFLWRVVRIPGILRRIREWEPGEAEKSLLSSASADVLQPLSAELTRQAAKLAPRPGKLVELKGRPDAKALWGHVFCFEKWKGTMDYPEYRKNGWPIASSSVGSACGQVGDHIKHARMRWTRRRAWAAP